MRVKSTTIFLFFFFLNSFAQTSQCPCCDDHHSQFDFWVGEWAVYDTLDNLVGNNNIIKLYENCLIQENWISQGANRGTSYNYFDPSDSTWNQLWIDNQGTILKLKGAFLKSKMILRSELQKGQKVDWYYNRITWQIVDGKNVKQTWDVLDKNDKFLANLFTGIYKPVKE